ncbi:receptor-type adenylate cyclase, partial [Trypanosoma theileri]
MGAVCRCNQGGRTVYMKSFVEDYRTEHITEGTLSFDSLTCYTKNTTFFAPFNTLTLLLNNSHLAMKAAKDIIVGAALRDDDDYTSKHLFNIESALSTTNGAYDKLISIMRRQRVHAVVGVVTETMLDIRNVTFIDPLFLQPRLNKFRRHVIHLSPTVEQELFVLAQYLGNTSDASAAAVIRCDEAAAVEDVLRRSLVTFGGSLQSSALLADGDSLVGRLPSSGNVFVVGLADGDAAVI